MGKTIERMRSNPRADWRISDVERACREAGIACMKPTGGSHFKIGRPRGGKRLTIPARRPIKPVYPVYIVMLVQFLDEEGDT